MKWLVILVVALATLTALGAATTAEVPWTLVSGWAPYLVRVVPRVTVDWKAVGLGAAAVVLFTAGVHWLGRTANRSWRPTWSLAAVGAVVVLFAAGICLIGVVHQSGWLLSAAEPAIVEVDRPRWGTHSSITNLKYLTWSQHKAQAAYQDRYPNTVATDGTPLHGWPLWSLFGDFTIGEIDQKVPWTDPKNQKYYRCVMPLYINPAMRIAPVHNAEGHAISHYSPNCRAMADGNFRPFKEFKDGTATTLLIGEVNANFRPWGDPANCRDPARGINKSPYGFGGPTGSGGALFAMADGSVRFLSDRASPAVLKALATPDGGEPVDESVLGPPR